MIDGSKSLGEENFEIVKQFVAGIIDSLAVSPKAARVGLLQYSTQVRTEFTLGDFSSARDMKKAVAHMKYMGKGSMTGLALKHMFERSFNPVEGARPVSPGVSRVAIVFTDGRAQDDVSAWARRARAGGKKGRAGAGFQRCSAGSGAARGPSWGAAACGAPPPPAPGHPGRGRESSPPGRAQAPPLALALDAPRRPVQGESCSEGLSPMAFSFLN